MKFLITNDDGYDAPGLAALYRALAPLGEVVVVAPAVCHSSRGHAVDTKNRIRVEQRTVAEMGSIYVVHSSPADCVRVALRYLLDRPPEMVVAGINPGANLGVDLFYSGTAAAAREGALLGCPAIALSRLIGSESPIDWNVLSRHAGRVLRTLMAETYRLPAGHFWNVNFPAVRGEAYPENLTFVPHGIHPHPVAFEVVERTGDAEILEYSGIYRERGRGPDCDVHHLFSQKMTATPVGPALTSAWAGTLHSSVSLVDADCAD